MRLVFLRKNMKQHTANDLCEVVSQYGIIWFKKKGDSSYQKAHESNVVMYEAESTSKMNASIKMKDGRSLRIKRLVKHIDLIDEVVFEYMSFFTRKSKVINKNDIQRYEIK